MKNIESLLQEYGCCHHDSVACGGDFGTADKSGAAYDAVIEAIDNRHSGLQTELNAARALLREVVDMVSSEEYNDTIRKADAYLDACNTPGEPT